MRKLTFIVFVALLFIPACSPEPKTEDQKAFYALGVHLNKQLSVFDLSPEELKYVQQGLSDAAAGKKLAVDPDASIQKLGELAQARMAKATEKQKALAKPFLEKAAAEKGAQKTASGLFIQKLSPVQAYNLKPRMSLRFTTPVLLLTARSLTALSSAASLQNFHWVRYFPAGRKASA